MNAEKRLEEWKAEAEERRLEKLAEDFLKKKAKEGKKSSDLEVEKYLEKYRKDTERCVGEVEESVKESFGLYKESKRKMLPASGPGSSKKLKIWMGKKKVEDSDSDSDTDEDEEKSNEDSKSVIIDEGNGSSSSDKSEEEGTSKNDLSPVSGSSKGELSSRESLETISEEENNAGGTVESDASVEVEMQSNGESKIMANAEVTKMELPSQTPRVEINSEVADVGSNAEVTKTEVSLETPSVEVIPVVENSNGGSGLDEPLNFDNYNSPAELEALGMERLKSELQKNGLKCGGTLQERAARLFLLKTTPIDKLPKKLLAKPLA